MTYREMMILLENLPSYTPLADVVRIRVADDEEAKNFTKSQQRVRFEWNEFLASKANKGEVQLQNISDFQAVLKAAFSSPNK